MSQKLNELSSDILDMATKQNDIVKATIRFLVGAVTCYILKESGLQQMVQVLKLQDKMNSRRKRRDPNGYSMWKVKRSCRTRRD